MSSITARADYLLKHNLLLNKIFRIILSSILKCFGLFIPVDDKAVIFSAHGRKYNDSPKALYEYMISNSQFEGYKYYWAIDNPEETNIPGSCVKIRSDTFQYFKTALKCKYWITCVNIERGLKFKRKKTVYLNTWHGIPIKTVGNEAKGRNDYDFSNIDYFCVSGKYEIEIYKKSFKIPENNLIRTGMPRNDSLYITTLEEIYAIKRRLGFPLDKKLILYAPTWRDSKDGGKSYSIKPPINFDTWDKELKNNYIILLRTHPYTNDLLGVGFNDFIRDFSNYPNINDLLKVADILISDYSATIFDYAILEKPIICFAYDILEYREERGFTFDIEKEMPGGICRSETDVLDRIINLNYQYECSLVKSFKSKYLEYGGNATKHCIKIIFKKDIDINAWDSLN